MSCSSSSIRRSSDSIRADGGSVSATGGPAFSVGVAARRSCRIRAISRSRSRRLSVDRLAWDPPGVGDSGAVPRRSSGVSPARHFRPARGPVQAWPGASPRLSLEPSSRSRLAALAQPAEHLILGSAGACTRSGGRFTASAARTSRAQTAPGHLTVAPGPRAVRKAENSRLAPNHARCSCSAPGQTVQRPSMRRASLRLSSPACPAAALEACFRG